MCTTARIASKQGNYYWARTMDFATDFFQSGGGLSYFSKENQLDMLSGNLQPKYDFFGMGLPNTFLLTDGVNSEGLTGGIFYFEEATSATQESLEKKQKTEVVLDELVSYFLSQCSNVSEVSYLASQLVIIDKSTSNEMVKGSHELPLHLTFTDKEGKSIVLEPDHDGELTIYNNTIGTMANSPTYDWHMTNLRNYVNLSGYTVPELSVGRLSIKDIESGSGLLGLPGDYTSPSRFIRISLLINMMDTPDDDHAVNALYTAFNSVIIPKGIEKNSPTESDSTAYWAGYDLKNQELSVLPMEGQTFTKVSLNDLKNKFGTKNCSVKIDLSTNLYHSVV